MNMTLFKYFIRKNWLLWTAFVTLMLVEIMAYIFLMEVMHEMLYNMGFGSPTGDSALFFIAGLYPMAAVLFPMVYFIFVIHKIMSRSVDNSSMAAFLSSGIKRNHYTITAGVFVAISLVAMFTVIFVVGGLGLLFWGSFNWLYWLNLNVSFLLVNLAVASLCFLFSSTFPASKLGLALTIVFPILFLIFNMLAEYADFFRFMTAYGWIDAPGIALGTFNLWWVAMLVYICVSTILVTISVLLYRRKQLSI